MPRITSGSTHGLADAEAFLTLLDAPPASAVDLFGAEGEIIVARAPGRLDVMGGFGDYSGSHVLQMPIAPAACVALQRVAEPTARLISLGGDDDHRTSRFEMPMAELCDGGTPIDYDASRERFARDRREQWAAYVAGALVVLMHERGVRFEGGLRILIDSRVPEGKGVSSSAALEVASMTALAEAFGVSVEPRDLALLCQRVENRVVGAPCGVMDQMTAVFGEADRLMQLLCQPAELKGNVALPDGLAVWAIDSGIRHAVSGSDYTSVRAGTFIGFRVLAEAAGEDFGGYLSNLTPARFEAGLADVLPEAMAGGAFLDRYGGTADAVTKVEADREYPVRAPVLHAVYENRRVQRFAELLRGGVDESTARELGAMMHAAHDSYNACRIGSGGTDRLVELVREAGPERGLYGAKITGGGSGGCIAVLGRHEAEPIARGLARRYADETGRDALFLAGSSPGALAFGTLSVAP